MSVTGMGRSVRAVGLILLLVFASCGDRSGSREITATRTVRSPRPVPPEAPWDDAVRFGLQDPPSDPAAPAGER